MENKQKRNRPLNQVKREAIIKASIEEFYVKGYEGSSMDIISKEANVSKATVYNHFNNKEELFLAIVSLIKTRFEESYQYNYSKDKTLESQLYDMAKKEMDFLSLEENIKLIQIVTIVMIQKNEIGLKILEEIKEHSMIMTSTWFEEAKKDGKLSFDSSEFVSKQFIGMIKSFAFIPQIYGADTLNEKEQEEVIQSAIKMVKAMYLP